MIAPGGGLLRWTRGVVVATVTLLLSMVAHLSGGGSAPSVVVLLSATAGLTGFAVTASGRQWTRSRTVAAIVVAQVGLHSLFALATPMAGMTPMRPGPAVVAGAPMLAMHLIAALLLALLLARGDAALWRLAAVLSAMFITVIGLLVRLPSRPNAVRAVCAELPARERTVSPARLLLRAGCLARRGPPHLVTG